MIIGSLKVPHLKKITLLISLELSQSIIFRHLSLSPRYNGVYKTPNCNQLLRHPPSHVSPTVAIHVKVTVESVPPVPYLCFSSTNDNEMEWPSHRNNHHLSPGEASEELNKYSMRTPSPLCNTYMTSRVLDIKKAIYTFLLKMNTIYCEELNRNLYAIHKNVGTAWKKIAAD